MRCKACDSRMTPKEASRKFLLSGEYADICTKCHQPIRDVAPFEDDDVRYAPPDAKEVELVEEVPQSQSNQEGVEAYDEHETAQGDGSD